MANRYIPVTPEEAEEEKKGGNIGLPFGLCEKYGIQLPPNARPRDAWEALKNKTGLTPEDFYKDLRQESGSEREKIQVKNEEQKEGAVAAKTQQEDTEKLYNEIKRGKRFTYDELLENPVVKEFEKKAQEAERLAKQKAPISDKDKAKYGERFLERAKKVPKQYRADIVMGLPAAGKSSAVVNSLKDKYGSFEFDNDEIKKLLPGYNEYGAAYVHDDSKAVQNYAFNAFKKGGALSGANLAIPIIGSKVSQVVDGWIKPLREAGYDIHVHHVGISNTESMNRMVGRAISTGRYIPLHVIDKYGEKPKEVYEQLKKEGRKEVTFE